MQLHHQHRWDVTPKEAIAIQQQLRGEVKLAGPYDRDHPPETVAGVDVGFEAANTITRAAVVVLDFPSLEPRAHAIYREPTRFPYVPGLLSFREIPAVLGAMKKLKSLPDLLLCDGQGIAHPRRLGIASHLGLLTGIPSIGVGKSRLIGSYEEPGEEKGSWTPLLDKGETIGAVVRTRSNTKPLYISPGHGIDLESAIYYVLACTRRYKLPETTREAHNLASSK
jgi:deoxyribonuclease V